MRRACPLILAAALTACSPGGPAREPADASGNAALDEEVAAVINLQDRTEIDVLKNRVVALEREVGELKANPQTLDLDLLTRRVEQLEVGAATAAPSVAAESPRSTTPAADPDRAQRAVDAAIAERRARRTER